MSTFDAPEYVRCTHIGICEFLDLSGHILRTLVSDIPSRHAHAGPRNFVDILENMDNENESRRHYAFLSPPAVLRSCASLFDPSGHLKFIGLNTYQRAIAFLEDIPSQHIQIIEVSTILC